MDLIPARLPLTGVFPIDKRLQRVNTMQSAVALLGGVSIVAAVNLYKYAQPLGDQTLVMLSTALFVGGWLIIALAVSGGTYGSVIPANLKSIIAFASAAAVIAGAMIERQKLDAASAGKPPSANNLGMMLFLGGWAGIGLSMAMGGAWRLEKIVATIAAIGVTLGGVYWTAQLEMNDQNQLPGKVLFGAGWVLMALAIGFVG